MAESLRETNDPPRDTEADCLRDQCIICGTREATPRYQLSDRLHRTTDRIFSIVACSQCGMLRLRPQPHPDELSHYYPPTYWFSPEGSIATHLAESYRRFVLRDHLAFVVRALRESSESGQLLDVGCGGGLFLSMMKEKGFDGCGLDNSKEAAAVAKTIHKVQVYCGALDSAPFGSESFAAITMFHVLEHLYDPGAYLDAARRLLRSNGTLIVQVPDASCWQVRVFGRRWNNFDVPRHLFDFRAADIEALLASHGFDIVRRKHFSLRDNPAGLASTIAPFLDPMSRHTRASSSTSTTDFFKDILFLALTVASIPFTLAEAAAGHGSTVMIQARRRTE